MSDVHYTKGGNWTPTIPNQSCERCGVIYTAHKYDQRFCSKSCSQLSRTEKRAAEIYTERTCPGCGVKWSGPPSNVSKYCSKSCIFASGEWAKPEDRECEHCATVFSARRRRSRDEWERFCSTACVSESHTNKVEKICANCGEAFEVHQSRADELTCSRDCRDAYYIRDRAPAWTGGVVAQNDRPYRRIDRDGYAAKYEGEHRLIAAREIGRGLRRGEVVFTLDQNNENLSPGNLFLCPSQSEFGLIRCGAVAWPSASNLRSYREAGYVRPDVLVTVHEWEHGRRPGKGGKWIKRHPQADEIIKRRRAGASLSILCDAFGLAKSNMANILRNRL